MSLRTTHHRTPAPVDEAVGYEWGDFFKKEAAPSQQRDTPKKPGISIIHSGATATPKDQNPPDQGPGADHGL